VARIERFKSEATTVTLLQRIYTRNEKKAVLKIMPMLHFTWLMQKDPQFIYRKKQGQRQRSFLGQLCVTQSAGICALFNSAIPTL
jgi:hypothetical protein